MYSNKSVQLDYQRRWMLRRRMEWISANGGACVQCGSTDNLEVDHVTPSNKITHRVWSYASGFRERELSKCQILCHKCHQEKHLKVTHGTRSRYIAGCRCHDCKKAMSVCSARWRANKKAKSTT